MTNNNKINRQKNEAFESIEKKSNLINNQRFFYRPLNFSTKNNFHKFFNLKRFLGCLSYDIVTIDNKPLKIKEYIYNYHNLFHYEISHLDIVVMGKDKVSGIHGFYSPMFHSCYFEPEYDGMLDEARVAIHEWLTRTSIFSTLKALNWMLWLTSIRINCTLVVIAHTKSIKNYQGDQLFDFKNSKNPNLYSFLQNFC